MKAIGLLLCFFMSHMALGALVEVDSPSITIDGEIMKFNKESSLDGVCLALGHNEYVENSVSKEYFKENIGLKFNLGVFVETLGGVTHYDNKYKKLKNYEGLVVGNSGELEKVSEGKIISKISCVTEKVSNISLKEAYILAQKIDTSSLAYKVAEAASSNLIDLNYYLELREGFDTHYSAMSAAQAAMKKQIDSDYYFELRDNFDTHYSAMSAAQAAMKKQIDPDYYLELRKGANTHLVAMDKAAIN